MTIALPSRELLTELQSLGMRLAEADANEGRRGGAGPSDHRAVTLDGQTIMVPVHNGVARRSPFTAKALDDGRATLLRHETPVGTISYPPTPRFYGLQTFDGIPYWKIALLHGRDVLATTVLQECIRANDAATTCQFCAIGQSLKSGRTIAHKSPAQLAEVARAAVLLDGVTHMVMTTGTPNGDDRGAAVLSESAFAIKAAVALPIQAQCEPPRDFAWFPRLKAAGVDSLGLHLEAATDATRRRIMPGKARIPIGRYLEAFASAVPVFGRGQVSTYILAGLGDSADDILALCETLIGIGVYPFVVPFVPLAGTPLTGHPAPDPAFMRAVLAPLGRMLREADLVSERARAGCSKCGACSALSAFEREEHGAAAHRAGPVAA